MFIFGLIQGPMDTVQFNVDKDVLTDVNKDARREVTRKKATVANFITSNGHFEERQNEQAQFQRNNVLALRLIVPNTGGGIADILTIERIPRQINGGWEGSECRLGQHNKNMANQKYLAEFRRQKNSPSSE